jgi:MYXO-CTERM domain-containing protein
MLTALALASIPAAATWGAYEAGFVSPARDDAPIDGVIVYAANYSPDATATDDDGNVVALASIDLTQAEREPRVGLLPPVGGWGSDTTWHLSVLGYYDGQGEVATLTFSTGSAPAGPPPPFVVGAVEIGEWSAAEETYAWGCCHPVRTVTIPVSSLQADVWDRVELVGLFSPRSTTDGRIYTVQIAVGPGQHDLVFQQWDEDGSIQPPCFEVVPVSAAGVRGPAEEVCVGEEEGEGDAVAACGCRTPPGSGAGVWLLAAVALLRRRTCTDPARPAG